MGFSDHVKVQFGADTTDFNNQLAKAEGKISSFANKYSKVFLGALGAVALKKTTEDVIKFGAEIQNMSQRLGASAGFLQSLAYGAEQSGIKAGAAMIAFQRFTRRVEDAKNKGGPLKDTLDELGIQFTTTGGKVKDNTSLFKEFGQKLSELEDPSKKVSTAFKFLDTEGVGLAQMFVKGGKTIDDFGNEAERLGILLDDKTVKSLSDADATLEQLGRQFKVVAANFLAPLIDKLSDLGKKLVSVGKFVNDYRDQIIALTAAIGAYKIASVAFTAVTAVTTGLGLISDAVSGTTKKVKALNVAMKANAFGIFVVGLTGLGFAIKEFIDWLDKGKKAVEDWKDKTAKEAKTLEREISLSLQAVNDEIKDLNDELQAIGDPDKQNQIDLGLDVQIQKLEETKKALEKNAKIIKEDLRIREKILDEKTKEIDKLKDLGHGEEFIAKETAKRKQLVLDIANFQKDLLQNTLDLEKNQITLNQKVKEHKDEQFAIANNLVTLLQDRKQEVVELERSLEIQKALKDGGKELADVVKQRHEMEDLIVDLIKDQKMPLEEAHKLALALVQAKANEKILEDGIKAQADAKKDVMGKQVDKQKALNAEIEEEKRLRDKAKLKAQQQLDILRLRAQGQNRQADLLQAQIDLEQKIKDIMDAQGVVALQAQLQLEEKVKLEAEIKRKKVEQKEEEIKKDAVEQALDLKKKGRLTREERQRLTAARRVKHAEQLVNDLMQEGTDRAEIEIQKLEDLKQKSFEIILDDDSKQAIADLQAQKADIDNGLDLQVQALNNARADIDQQVANARLEADKNKADLVAEGKIQQQAHKDIGKENVDALEDAGKAVVDAIEKIANPQVIVNIAPDPASASTPTVPTINNIIEVIINSDLKQSTQEEILTTLQGYFINQ